MKASDLKDIDIQELFEKLQNLDMENVGSWPAPVKIGAAVIVLALVLVLGYSFSITGLNDQLSRAQAEESNLMQQLESRAHRAHNLDQYREQLAEMEETFGTLLQQLPRETEVPGLLEDITHTGLGSGLEFDKIELAKETQREFYAELPIQITVRGDYHGFGAFVSGVAALPRIVTLHDFEINAPASRGRGGSPEATNLLAMNITAKTYRYATAPPPAPANRNTRRR
ncbi:type 4a pilus biogenesis protein PilO [Alcanivorax quisquiliarum]|uniref:Type 4a pilus biogenesis protein PilO n=1 Tax=Alcanivorax quisquiliarum TaxID=2933565 RepID=A0ABT0E5T4_9GAMM|nr:type 4a pilus biogenesis protein PilO [Alcanivorax quisquiliarum]MCK0537188.1 type 4a pilus biogenesis protein PilO [Alcanivorax quisquiliarum]